MWQIQLFYLINTSFMTDARKYILLAIIVVGTFLVVGFAKPSKYVKVVNTSNGDMIEFPYNSIDHDGLLQRNKYAQLEERFNINTAAGASGSILILGAIIIGLSWVIKKSDKTTAKTIDEFEAKNESNTIIKEKKKNYNPDNQSKKEIRSSLFSKLLLVIVVTIIGGIMGLSNLNPLKGEAFITSWIAVLVASLLINYLLPIFIALIASIKKKQFNLYVFNISFWILLVIKLIFSIPQILMFIRVNSN